MENTLVGGIEITAETERLIPVRISKWFNAYVQNHNRRLCVPPLGRADASELGAKRHAA